MYWKADRLVTHLAIAALASAALTGAAAAAAAQGPVASYSAVAVNMLSTAPGTGTTPVNIVVTRWSTDAEHDRVITTLLEQGEGALLGVLEELPVAGSVAPTGGVGFNIHYASHAQGPDGMEQVVLLTTRPMSFWERRDAGRSTDYPFTLIELRLRPDGSGEGKASVASRVMVDKANRTLVLDNYNDQPVLLRAVRRN